MNGKPATTGIPGIARFHCVRIKPKTRSLDLSIWTALSMISSIAIHPVLVLNTLSKQLIRRSRGIKYDLRPALGTGGLRSYQMPSPGLRSYLMPLDLRMTRLAASRTVRQVSTMHCHHLFLSLKVSPSPMSPSFPRKFYIRDHETSLRYPYLSWPLIVTVSRKPSAAKLSTSICKICDRKFADRKSLWNHDQATHKKKRYNCDFARCAYIATRTGNLRRHKRLMHGH
jgi:hypothetical protein